MYIGIDKIDELTNSRIVTPIASGVVCTMVSWKCVV